MSTPNLSVILITKNEAHRIERCLRSVDFADEVIIVDSGSTDGTAQIATQLGARVIGTSDWPGFGPQKNRALALARGRWVFSIDADELVDLALRQAIIAAVAPQADGPVAYWVRRSSSFCGQLIRFGDWRKDRVLRLFRRGHARFSNDLVHERVVCEQAQGELQGLLLHDSIDSLQDGIDKADRYARAGAVRLRAKGRGGFLAALLHASWTFIRGYFIRLGFLDGRSGLLIAALNTWGTYRRYLLAGRNPSGD